MTIREAVSRAPPLEDVDIECEKLSLDSILLTFAFAGPTLTPPFHRPCQRNSTTASRARRIQRFQCRRLRDGGGALVAIGSVTAIFIDRRRFARHYKSPARF